MTTPPPEETGIRNAATRPNRHRTTSTENRLNHRTAVTTTVLYLAAVGAITGSLTACGSSHRTGPGTPPVVTQSPATAGAPDPTATGRALKALLPAGTDLASGVTVTDADDSGSDWTAPDVLSAPRLSGADCAALPTITADEASADFRASYAKETITFHNTPIAQLVVAGTNPGDAARQIDEVKALADRCRTFSAPNSDGVPVGGTVTATTVPGLGDQALDVRVTASGPNAASYQQPELILVRVGDKLAVVSDNYPSQDNGSALKAAEVLTARLTGQPV